MWEGLANSTRSPVSACTVTSGCSLARGRRLMRSLYCCPGLGFARATLAWTARNPSTKPRDSISKTHTKSKTD
jgi:hypothetical protein